MRARRFGVLAVLFICTLPSQAAADWLLMPFVGTSFGPETTFLIFEEGAGRKLTLGGSVALIGDGFLGLEADVGHTPRFFEGDNPLGLVLTGRVTTVGGNVVITVPLSVVHESLRPYVVGGLGLMQARSKHAAGLFPVDRNLLGVTVGGGAIGFVSARTGLRFDVRHIKAASGANGPFARPDFSRLSFWRATVGLVFRY